MRELRDLVRARVRRGRARDHPFAEGMKLTVRAIARLEERSVGRPQAAASPEDREQHLGLDRVMGEQGAAGGQRLLDEDVEGRIHRGGGGSERAREGMVHLDQAAVVGRRALRFVDRGVELTVPPGRPRGPERIRPALLDGRPAEHVEGASRALGVRCTRDAHFSV